MSIIWLNIKWSYQLLSNNEISGFISNDDCIKFILPEDLLKRAPYLSPQASYISYGQQGSNSACPQRKGDIPTLPSPTANTPSTHKVSKEPYSSFSLSHKTNKQKKTPNTTSTIEMLILRGSRKRGKNFMYSKADSDISWPRARRITRINRGHKSGLNRLLYLCSLLLHPPNSQ